LGNSQSQGRGGNKCWFHQVDFMVFDHQALRQGLVPKGGCKLSLWCKGRGGL
jgi:hypothetical protein